MMRINYVDFGLETENPDEFKKELIDIEKTCCTEIIMRMLLKYAQYYQDHISIIAERFGIACSQGLENKGELRGNFKEIPLLTYRLKCPRAIFLKTKRYEGGILRQPPRSNHAELPRYPFYDVYGIAIITYGTEMINKEVLPFFNDWYDEVLPRKNYIDVPHENNYQGIHLVVKPKKTRMFSPVLDIHIQDEVMYKHALETDYHEGKYEKEDDYFARRSLMGKGTWYNE
jgi:ppGpp synthetase/RelA/SpoT-type nucleotidyltranferase